MQKALKKTVFLGTILSVVALLFLGGILEVNAATIEPDTYDNVEAILTLNTAEKECWASFEVDGTFANGQCYMPATHACPVVGGVCSYYEGDGIDPPEDYGYRTINETGDFHVVVFPDITAYTYCTDYNNNNGYQDCLANYGNGFVNDFLISYIGDTSTTTSTTTVNVDTRGLTAGFFVSLWIMTFLITTFGIAKFT